MEVEKKDTRKWRPEKEEMGVAGEGSGASGSSAQGAVLNTPERAIGQRGDKDRGDSVESNNPGGGERQPAGFGELLRQEDEQKEPGQPGGAPPGSGAKGYSWAEICQHRSPDSCWLAYRGKVYDVSRFVGLHPGGEEWILRSSGTDVTRRLEGPPHRHSANAVRFLQQYWVGELLREPAGENRVAAEGGREERGWHNWETAIEGLGKDTGMRGKSGSEKEVQQLPARDPRRQISNSPLKSSRANASSVGGKCSDGPGIESGEPQTDREPKKTTSCSKRRGVLMQEHPKVAQMSHSLVEAGDTLVPKVIDKLFEQKPGTLGREGNLQYCYQDCINFYSTGGSVLVLCKREYGY
nr:PREDICTED: uncharacterized protein LOC102367411 [Latimeria chalumnae]|eukprot:XP_006000202.1 PREDICTED: uncharacterized protein LOC102367411 [Latimeria chalumnae]